MVAEDDAALVEDDAVSEAGVVVLVAVGVGVGVGVVAEEDSAVVVDAL